MDVKLSRRLIVSRLIDQVNRAAAALGAAGLDEQADRVRCLTLRCNERSARAVALRLNQARNAAAAEWYARLDVCHSTPERDAWRAARRALKAAEAAMRATGDAQWLVMRIVHDGSADELLSRLRSAK